MSLKHVDMLILPSKKVITVLREQRARNTIKEFQMANIVSQWKISPASVDCQVFNNRETHLYARGLTVWLLNLLSHLLCVSGFSETDCNFGKSHKATRVTENPSDNYAALIVQFS